MQIRGDCRSHVRFARARQRRSGLAGEGARAPSGAVRATDDRSGSRSGDRRVASAATSFCPELRRRRSPDPNRRSSAPNRRSSAPNRRSSTPNRLSTRCGAPSERGRPRPPHPTDCEPRRVGTSDRGARSEARRRARRLRRRWSIQIRGDCRSHVRFARARQRRSGLAGEGARAPSGAVRATDDRSGSRSGDRRVASAATSFCPELRRRRSPDPNRRSSAPNRRSSAPNRRSSTPNRLSTRCGAPSERGRPRPPHSTDFEPRRVGTRHRGARRGRVAAHGGFGGDGRCRFAAIVDPTFASRGLVSVGPGWRARAPALHAAPSARPTIVRGRGLEIGGWRRRRRRSAPNFGGGVPRTRTGVPRPRTDVPRPRTDFRRAAARRRSAGALARRTRPTSNRAVSGRGIAARGEGASPRTEASAAMVDPDSRRLSIPRPLRAGSSASVRVGGRGRPRSERRRPRDRRSFGVEVWRSAGGVVGDVVRPRTSAAAFPGPEPAFLGPEPTFLDPEPTFDALRRAVGARAPSPAAPDRLRAAPCRDVGSRRSVGGASPRTEASAAMVDADPRRLSIPRPLRAGSSASVRVGGRGRPRSERRRPRDRRSFGVVDR
jgi:hypothetical protein